MCACIGYTHHVHISVCEGQKRALYPLELEYAGGYEIPGSL